MTERWDRLKTLFDAALSVDPERQDGMLEAMCPDDPDLRGELRALVGAYAHRGFVDELSDRLATFAETPARTRIGRYEIIEQIGRGGMGIVWKARDPHLDRVVALKLLPPLQGFESEHRQQLLTEARAAAALDHPAIATVYEIGETGDGELFLAMAFYEGETLEACVARGPLQIRETVRIATEVASGLAAAHARGITHRDLKPANILLTHSGSVKLLDFGIAKVAGVRETNSGTPLGTLAYMSPEQVRGENVGPPADVWAFGVLLYEMLTGERPTRDPRPAAPREMSGKTTPLLSSRRGDVPRGLASFVERALSSAPGDRYRDGSDMCEALQRLADDQTVEARDPGPCSTLPMPLTRFFGREREIDEITRMLGSQRLLTLTGPAGTGKTRLALQVASALRRGFADGAAFVSLASVVDPQLVPSEIGRVIGMPEHPAVPPLAALASFLQRRHMLLLLDNFEHVVQVAPLVTTLLAECARVTIVVTSRVPLRVSGEQEYPVPPLPHPVLQEAGAAVALNAYPATALFVDRARAVCPDFIAAGDQAAAIADICARLDGLPLAIELAAARIKLFSPRAMLGRLDRRFELLSDGARDQPPRHQSLRHAVAWSYDLLTPAEQQLFRRLSVFRSGFTLEGAEGVCDTRQDLGVEVVDGVASLIDKSLVQQVGQFGDDMRFAMLETLREYGLERLAEQGEAAFTRTSHAAYCLVLAEEGNAQLTAPEYEHWLARCDLEHGNFLAALDWLTGQDHAEWGLRLVLALFPFWEQRELHAVGRERTEAILRLRSTVRTSRRAMAILYAATFALTQADYDGGLSLYHEALDIFQEVGDRRGAVIAFNALGSRACLLNDMGAARSWYEQSVSACRELRDRVATAAVLSNLANVVSAQGDQVLAKSMLDEALSIFCELGDWRAVGWSFSHLGDVAREQGDLEAASRLYQQGAETFRSHDDPWGLARSLADIGSLASEQGNHDRASTLLRDALTIYCRLGHRRGIAKVFEGLTALAARQGNAERALTLVGAASALRQAVGAPQRPRDKARLETALAGLGDQGGEAMREISSAGSRMTLPEAVRYALDGGSPTGSNYA